MVFHEVRTVDGAGTRIPAPWDACRTAQGDVSEAMRLLCLPWRFRHTSAVSLRRRTAELIFPVTTTLRGNPDDLIAGAAALLGPVTFLPEPLSLYRVHGDNLFAARFLDEYNRARGGAPVPGPTGRRRAAAGSGVEDVDGGDLRTRQIRLSEEQAAFANRVLSRAGLPGGLSPWTSPDYRECRLWKAGRSRLSFVVPVLAAYGAMQGVPIGKRAKQAARALLQIARGA
jgi:hypothetical protein